MSLDVYLCPPKCDHCGVTPEGFSANITHNLRAMADAAGIYKVLWRPDEYGFTKASQIAPILREGLARLKAEPEFFRTFNAGNGWGTYEDFVPWVEKYLAACESMPNADIEVSR